MKALINVIGYSGSGKTHLINNAIKRLKEELNYDSAVFKYIHEHKIDKEGSDSYLYEKAGANYSVTKNSFDETVIFLKQHISIEELSTWIQKGPFNVDIIFTEGFRGLDVPTILCVNDLDSLDEQLTSNVKMISGIICKTCSESKQIRNEIPIVDITENFRTFLQIFSIEK
jgi:molybdopterin-guanine dinucleotide biosynthesis protein MobB